MQAAKSICSQEKVDSTERPQARRELERLARLRPEQAMNGLSSEASSHPLAPPPPLTPVCQFVIFALFNLHRGVLTFVAQSGIILI